ncbi:MAG: response regulator [Melioribacteraceae bacterium]|nr:response regulator [Melioribacteraceae bacterium]MCF8353745.1 response regulator [Melioribacteraceae bacterium]MCF8392446.1 response regulator [Melioribacteraceae bacterium]MCF8418357.1 response regulator [Melioribacteraceae bacterium]
MKKIILLADDSPTIRKFVAFSLKMKGYEVLSASDGMEAMEMLPDNAIDLIITDLNMPNLDGFSLINMLRENPDYEDVPIIILSSLSSGEEIKRGMSCGANSYLIKPFNPERIHYEVSKYLN